MSNKELIEKLHKAGYVILHANRTTNSPIGWLQDDGSMGYKEQMRDATLAVYKETFDSKKLAVQHNGFYLGFNQLCCIDFDVKKTSSIKAEKLVKKLIAKYGDHLVVETTKSKGFHVYFRFNGAEKRNEPKFFSAVFEKNWIELYYHSRFIGCWLSATKKYELKYGDLLKLKPIASARFNELYKDLSDWSGRVEPAKRKNKKSKGAASKSYDNKEDQQRAIELVEEIVRNKVDITGGYHDWFAIGMGFANLFGKDGLDKFVALSQFSPSYNADTIEDTYLTWVDDDLRFTGKERISIGTFFDICKKYKIGEVTLVRGGSKLPAKRKKKVKDDDGDDEKGLVLNKKETMEQHLKEIVTSFPDLINYLVCNQEVYKFNGTYWELLTENEVVKEFNAYAEAIGYDKASTLSFMEKLLRYCMIVFRRVKEMNPFRKSFNLKNGVLIFNPKHSIEFAPHSADYLFTYQLDYDYNPDAQCPLFSRFINRVIPNEVSQQSLFKYIASIFSERKIEQMFFLIGGGANGKSVLLATLQQLFGNACTTTSLSRLTSPEHSSKSMYEIWNKLLAVSYDDKGIHDMQIYKSLASLEPLPVKRLYFDEFITNNYARLIIAMNSWSMIESTIGASRRFIGISMDITIPSDEQDLALQKKLAKELSGILNLVVAQHLNKEDMIVSDEQREFVDTIVESSDYVGSFLKDKYELLSKDKSYQGSHESVVKHLAKKIGIVAGDAERIIKFMTLTDLYSDYREWCGANGIRNILIRKNFTTRLEARWDKRIEDDKKRLGYYVKLLNNE